MRAWQLDAPVPMGGRLRAVELPEPEPGPGEVRVRVLACAICRTDLHLLEGELAPRRLPVVPGHQIVGRVDRVGAGVASPAIGERVGIAWVRATCGACARCRGGRENLCERAEFTGWDADGGYAEYATVPAAWAHRLPAGVGDIAAAPLLCAGIIGARALGLAGVAPGGRLLLYGFGSSAHLTLQLARGRGLDVWVATRGEPRRHLARQLGADWAGGLDDAPPGAADGAIVFAPAGEIVPRALAAVAPGGTVALAGIHMSPTPPLDYAQLQGERALRSVTANTRADARDFLAEAAALGLRAEVTAYPLDDVPRALDDLARGRLAGSGVLVVDAAPR